MPHTNIQERYIRSTGLPNLPAISGLSQEEAQRWLKQEGFNELPASRRRSLFGIALSVVREPMFLLLLAGGGIYLALGDVREALVIRGGTERRIAGREVVRGDVVVLAEGDRVPADGVLLWSLNLSVDESLLTGESVPVRKRAAESDAGMSDAGHPGGDDLPFVFSGTLVTQGQGIAEIKAIGARTELGKIGAALQKVKPEQTRLQRETGRLVRLMAAAGIALCALVVLLYGLLRGNWLNGLLAGIALAIARANHPLQQMLKRAGLIERIGPEHLYPTVRTGVQAYLEGQTKA